MIPAVFRIRMRIQLGLWIRIRIGNTDPDPGARKVAKIKIKNNIFFYIELLKT